jgi:glycosyltransferase involved in cell wall biosynthesis
MDTKALLCVCNYPSNTGYAWDFIESLYARIADSFHEQEIRTFVAFPEIPLPPKSLNQSTAIPVLLDATLNTLRSVVTTARFIRDHSVRVIYFTDLPVRNSAYLLLRLTGVRHIVVHDHTSGKWKRPSGLKYLAKWVLARLPGVNADAVIAVSDYVARRHQMSGLVPSHKMTRIWNGIPLFSPNPCEQHQGFAESFGVEDSTPIVFCACRADRVKGVTTLVRAFDLVVSRWRRGEVAPILLYAGDGPHFEELQTMRNSIAARDRVIFLGYRQDVKSILEKANVCVVPSLWEDALPLSVLEPMAMGRPVIASAVGGVPEMIIDNCTGILVPPGDEHALANAIMALLLSPEDGKALGRAARARVAECFNPTGQITSIMRVLQQGF